MTGYGKAPGKDPHGTRGEKNSVADAMDAANEAIGSIMGGVADSLGSFDYSQLGDALQQLGNGVGQAAGAIGRGIGQGVRGFGDAVAQAQRRGPVSPPVDYSNFLPLVGSSTTASARMVLDWVGAVAMAIIALAMFSIVAVGGVVSLAMGAPFVAAAVILIRRAGYNKGLSQLLASYARCRNVLLHNPTISVTELAGAAHVSPALLPDQLEEFIARSWTPEGHLNEDRSVFFLTHQFYQQYEQQRAQRAAQPYSDKQLATLQEIDDGIRRIAAAAGTLSGQAREDVEQTHLLAANIADEARRHPETISKLNMFSSYYLPTTTKLIEAYAEIAAKSRPSDAERNAAKQILDSLEEINDAFQKLLYSMSEERTLDVETDLEAMRSMLRQDGLSD